MTRWARTRWARTRWVRTRWPPTKCRIEDGDIGDTRSPWPGQKWTRRRTTRSRSTAVRRTSISLRRKKGFGAPKECAGSTCISQCGQRTLHFFSQSKKQASPECFDILEAEKKWLGASRYTTQESETSQDRRIMPD